MQIKYVTVRQYGGRVVEKVLVKDQGDVLLVTTPEEWEISQREEREPVTVGFKREYVVDLPIKK